MEIRTNWVPRELLSWHEIPAREQEYFDYLDDDTKFQPRFVEYKGEFHDAIDTQYITTHDGRGYMGWAMRVDENSPLAKWDTIASDSYFSGMLFKFTTDDRCIVGRYFS